MTYLISNIIDDPKTSINKLLNNARKLSEKTFKISKNFDDAAKIAMFRLLNNPKYAHLLEQMGMDAQQYTKFVLFDYNALSPTEHNVMRTIFPFYTWARKNFEFQLRNFLPNLKRYRGLFKLLKGWRQGLTGGDENEADYNEKYFPIWNSDGKITYVKFDLPYQNVDEIIKGTGVVNSLTPLIKTPLEMITGYDFYTGRNFNTTGMMPSLGLGISNMLFTFNKAMQILFNDYKPTWEDKKIAGILGKKILDVIQVGKYATSLVAGQTNDDMISSLGKLFPSIFTQSDIDQTLYYNAQARKRKLQAAQEYYLKNNRR